MSRPVRWGLFFFLWVWSKSFGKGCLRRWRNRFLGVTEVRTCINKVQRLSKVEDKENFSIWARKGQQVHTWVEIRGMCTWGISITGRQTERSRVATDGPVAADWRQRAILKWRSCGYMVVENSVVSRHKPPKRLISYMLCSMMVGVCGEADMVAWIGLWKWLLTYIHLILQSVTFRWGYRSYWYLGPCLLSYLHSCLAAGNGWRRGCWCWWWDRWGRCQGSYWGHSRGRCSEGLSMAPLGRTLKHKTHAHNKGLLKLQG